MRLSLAALPGIPVVRAGDDLCKLIARALRQAEIVPESGDIVVVAQKVVSKAEGRDVRLADIQPSQRAREIAAKLDRDPRLIEVILSETAEILRMERGVLITVHRLGFIMANAGVDQSNVSHEGGERALLLPRDPDASSTSIKARLDDEFGVSFGVVINDSFGRPWRNGVVGVALGAAGMPSLRSLVGAPDLFGRVLKITQVAVADEVAAAASLLMGQAAEGRPVVHVRGVDLAGPPCPASALLRPKERDLFR